MQNNTTITATSVWQYFSQITNIPRPSKKEAQIRAFLLDFAKKQGLDAITDNAGNVLIRKPASADRKTTNTLILQSHMDMVCEKNNDSIHNFDTDPIQTQISGDWMQAKDTTLGADNGIGMAMQLAVLADKEMSHPNLECLFTCDEETGLYGASNLDPTMLRGETLLNLDTEEEGEFCIGCAGGMDTLITIPKIKQATPENFFFFTVAVSGLLGGHSGEDINKHRANSIKILTHYLHILQTKTDLYIAEINGGNLRNAIPREAQAILAVPYKDKELVRVEINHFIAEVENEYQATEKQFRFDLESTDIKPFVLSKELSNNLIQSLLACPHGVSEMHPENSNLVLTSTNLAAIHSLDETIFIETSQRSANEKKKKAIAETVAANFKACQAQIEKGKDYPGWEPNMQSPILKSCIDTYQKLFDKAAIVKTIHAGLECGVIAQKYPLLDMISIGPTITGAHSPSEKVQISSVEKCWQLLIQLLKTV